MDASSPVCVICNRNNEKVLLFEEKTLQKCKNVKKIRFANGLKYRDVDIPLAVSAERGYHPKCYKSFTALMKKYIQTNIIEEFSTTSSVSSQPSTSAQNIPSVVGDPESHEETPSSASSQNTAKSSTQEPTKTCMFCNASRLRLKYNEQKLHTAARNTFEGNVIAQATELEDFQFLEKINASDYLSYHNHCRAAYHNKYQSAVSSRREPTAWHIIRKYHNEAYDELCTFIEDNIIKNQKFYFLSFLSNFYNSYLKGLLEDNAEFEEKLGTVQHLRERILKTFDEQIKIHNLHNQNVVAHINAVVDESTYLSLKESNDIRETALTLRDKIFKMKINKLPKNLCTKDLIAGECSIPEELGEFYRTLLGGLNQRRRQSVDCHRKVKSLAEDAIYATRNGQVKTSKHVTLGMAMKSLTSSRKVIDILNRFGHCCSYNTIEELETEATFFSADSSSICPQGITLSPDLCMGVAFDNFDRYVETCSGKDTLHDTVGIIFQNVTDVSDVDAREDCENYDGNEFVNTPGTRRRRSYEAIIPELQSYPKRPRMVDVLLPSDNELRLSIPDNLKIIKQVDVLWMLSHAFEIPNTPMWVGFNSKIVQDNSPKQKVTYLTPINLSPTDKSVVLETMSQAQKAAQECHQRYIQITYDLAIAKIALQIQATEHPRFDNVFIHLGSFHIMMAYFKAIGKFIDDCGLSYMMVQSDLLASGSVNGYISGKHFNRCKRLHPIVAVALEILHFRNFVEQEKLEIDETTILALGEFSEQKQLSPVVESAALTEILKIYSVYQEATLQGKHGKTAQFYATYMNLVNYYLILTRSVRTGDFELFKYILPKIANLFFVFNQPNYARWLVKYHDNLMKIEDTHPGLQELLQKGCFGIKRTDKPFSRQPIDLTLEQTINADAARRLTGVIHFTNSISARQRWSRSHSIRSSLISHVYEEAGLQKAQDITADLARHQIEKNSAAVKKFMDTINQNINPFRNDLDKDVLYNIATGRAATDEISNFLLNVEESGSHLRENFIAECATANDRFEKPIKRNAVNNFSASSAKRLVKVGNKVQEVKMQRDLFGRMLGVSMENNIDIAKIVSFPLTPVPMSMGHLDGSMNTMKSAFMNFLENRIASDPPPNIDVVVLDGFFILHLIREVPKTFGGISKKILQMVTRYPAPRIDVVFDRYFTPSIKDNERARRSGLENRSYVISGSDQTRPADFGKELRNARFKEALVQFLINHWASDEVIPFIGNKTIYLNFDRCHAYEVLNGRVEKTIDEQLSCEKHEEADTKMVYHVCNIDYAANAVIRCSDTDVLVIMLGNMEHLAGSVNIWMDAGTGNHQRWIDITKLFNNLGKSLARALPGLHAITVTIIQHSSKKVRPDLSRSLRRARSTKKRSQI